jgi:hypothetical protein
LRGPLFHWPISSFTQGRADYLPRKLATNRDGRIRRKEPLQGVSGGGPPCNRNPGEAKNPPVGEVRQVLFKIVSRFSRANAVAINYNGIK